MSTNNNNNLESNIEKFFKLHDKQDISCPDIKLPPKKSDSILEVLPCTACIEFFSELVSSAKKPELTSIIQFTSQKEKFVKLWKAACVVYVTQHILHKSPLQVNK